MAMHVHYHSWYISLPSAKQQCEMTSSMLYRERERQQIF